MTTWHIDPKHSEVLFKVKYVVISTVTGQFKSFTGKLTTNRTDFDGADASFELEVDTVDTNDPDRDRHLKSDDFFSASQFPKIKFDGKLLKEGDRYKLIGPLTIKDFTKEVRLDVEYGGTIIDHYKQTRAGFEISGKINRRDFGLTWNAVTEAGGVVVSDEVRLALNVQIVKE